MASSMHQQKLSDSLIELIEIREPVISPPAQEQHGHSSGDTARMLKTLLGNLDSMVYRCRDDEFWTMEFVSEGCKSLTGYRPEDLLFNSRVSYEEVTHADDRARVRTMVRDAVAAGRRFDVVYRIVRADGTPRSCTQRGVPSARTMR